MRKSRDGHEIKSRRHIEGNGIRTGQFPPSVHGIRGNGLRPSEERDQPGVPMYRVCRWVEVVVVMLFPVHHY